MLGPGRAASHLSCVREHIGTAAAAAAACAREKARANNLLLDRASMACAEPSLALGACGFGLQLRGLDGAHFISTCAGPLAVSLFRRHVQQAMVGFGFEGGIEHSLQMQSSLAKELHRTPSTTGASMFV